MRETHMFHFKQTMLPWALAVLCGLAGCKGSGPEKAKEDVPKVTVTKVIEKPLGEFDYYTGRTAAMETVDIQCRVSGYLEDVKFKDGQEVKAGAVLALIDPAPFQTDYDKAAADEKRYNDLLTEVLEPKYQRAKGLPSSVISPEEMEKIQGDRLQAVSAVAAAKEQKKTAKIKLDWSTVKAPVAGVLSNARITKGNLVQADKTILTTLVSVDPMYAYFDVDENSVLAIKKRMEDGKFANYKDAKLPVNIGLANDKKGDQQLYPVSGIIDFVDNRVETNTGTLKVRGVFANPLKGELRRLSPGLFVRVQLPIGQRDKALWIPDRAVFTEQGRKLVYVVNSSNKVEARPVTLLKLEDGLRAIDPVAVVATDKGWRPAKEGEKSEPSLKPGESIVIVGMAALRPEQVVQPVLMAVDSLKQ